MKGWRINYLRHLQINHHIFFSESSFGIYISFVWKKFNSKFYKEGGNKIFVILSFFLMSKFVQNYLEVKKNLLPKFLAPMFQNISIETFLKNFIPNSKICGNFYASFFFSFCFFLFPKFKKLKVCWISQPFIKHFWFLQRIFLWYLSTSFVKEKGEPWEHHLSPIS